MSQLSHVAASAVLAASLAASVPLMAGAAARAASPWAPAAAEPPAKLFVDPPLPALLGSGAVVIPYRTENIRVVPVFGAGAMDVSPRVGHLHITVDELPWHWADAGANEAVVLVGLPPGPHEVLIELAGPDHRVITGQIVSFTVPAKGSSHH